MVSSVLRPDEINYKKQYTIEEGDVGHEVNVSYQVELFDMPIEIILGSENDSYKEQGVLYHPVYWLNNDNIHSKIGVWEFDVSQKKELIDEEGDYDIDMGIFLPFIEKSYLVEDKQESNEENELDGPKEKKEEYTSNEDTEWINDYLQDNDYGLIDNEGCGDCFFAMTRDALSGTDKVKTVEEQRELLSEKADEMLYTTYRELYDSFKSELDTKEQQIKDKKKELSMLKKRVEKTVNKSDKQKLLEEAKVVGETLKSTTTLKNDTIEGMKDFKFMEDIDSLEKLKAFIKTKDFWADDWAITTMEKELNVKFVILSEEMYTQKDVNSVVQCGQQVAEHNKRPDNYILVSYTGDHYKLITYQKRTNFDFESLPKVIKDLIIEKCVERNAGSYAINPDFKQYKIKLGMDKDLGVEEEVETQNYFDNSIVFRFYNKSAANKKPGEGSGEVIPPNRKIDYVTLNRYKNWRKKLDDTWESPITIDGRQWKTVEHYVLGSQYKKGFPDFYHKFSLDSESDISKDLTKARIASGKTGREKNVVYREKHIVPDNDYHQVPNPRKDEERNTALYSKFTQEEELKQILLETKQARLDHFQPGREPEIDTMLMMVRDKIRFA